jgi:hypothetical protein
MQTSSVHTRMNTGFLIETTYAFIGHISAYICANWQRSIYPRISSRQQLFSQRIGLHKNIGRQIKLRDQAANHLKRQWSRFVQDVGDAATGANHGLKVFAGQ